MEYNTIILIIVLCLSFIPLIFSLRSSVKEDGHISTIGTVSLNDSSLMEGYEKITINTLGRWRHEQIRELQRILRNDTKKEYKVYKGILYKRKTKENIGIL